MGYNNNNAGMHMIWHKHYGAYDDLSYYDNYVSPTNKKEIIGTPDHMKVETFKPEEEKTDVCQIESTPLTQSAGKEKQHTKGKKNSNQDSDEICQKDDELFENMQSEYQHLISKMMLFVIKERLNLSSACEYINSQAKLLKDKDALDSLDYILLICSKLGFRLKDVLSLDGHDAKSIVYDTILPQLNTDFISFEFYYDDDAYPDLKTSLSLMDYRDEGNIMRYMKGLVKASDDRLLPSIFVHYDIYISKTSGKCDDYQYAVYVEVRPTKHGEGFFDYCRVRIYEESSGSVRDFYERCYVSETNSNQ